MIERTSQLVESTYTVANGYKSDAKVCVIPYSAIYGRYT